MKTLSKLLTCLLVIAVFANTITLVLEIAYFFDIKILSLWFIEICIIFSLIYTKRNVDFMIREDEQWEKYKTRRNKK